MSIRSKAIVGLMLLFSTLLHAGDQLVRFLPKGESLVRIDGTGALHDWQVQGTTINGFLEVGAGFPVERQQEVRPGRITTQTEVTIPVASLRSVDLNGKPVGKSMNNSLYHYWRELAYPNIYYQLRELVYTGKPETETNAYAFDSRGALVVAGVTNQFSMPIRVFPLGGDKLKITGKLAVKMTDFGIQPPTIRLSPDSGSASGKELKLANDEIRLSFKWYLEKDRFRSGQ